MSNYLCQEIDSFNQNIITINFKDSDYCFSKETFKSLLSDPMCDQQTNSPIELTNNKKLIYNVWIRNNSMFYIKLFRGVIPNSILLEIEEGFKTFRLIDKGRKSLFYKNETEYNLEYSIYEVKVINQIFEEIKEVKTQDNLEKCAVKEDFQANNLVFDRNLIIFCFLEDHYLELNDKFKIFLNDFIEKNKEELKRKIKDSTLDFETNEEFINGLKEVLKNESNREFKLENMIKTFKSLKEEDSKHPIRMSLFLRTMSIKKFGVLVKPVLNKPYGCFTLENLKWILSNHVGTENTNGFDPVAFRELYFYLISNPANQTHENVVLYGELNAKLEELEKNIKDRTDFLIYLDYIGVWVDGTSLANCLLQHANTIGISKRREAVYVFENSKIIQTTIYDCVDIKRDYLFEKQFDKFENYFESDYAFITYNKTETENEKFIKEEWIDINSLQLSRGDDLPAQQVTDKNSGLIVSQKWFRRGQFYREDKDKPVMINKNYRDNSSLVVNTYSIEDYQDLIKNYFIDENEVIRMYYDKVVYLYLDKTVYFNREDDTPRLHIFTENKDGFILKIEEELKINLEKEDVVFGDDSITFEKMGDVLERLNQLGLDTNVEANNVFQYKLNRETDVRLKLIDDNKAFQMIVCFESINDARIPISFITYFNNFFIELDRIILKQGDIVVLNTDKIFSPLTPDWFVKDEKSLFTDVTSKILKVLFLNFVKN